MSKRKIIKWTLAISKTDEDDICLPFGTSVDTDTYGNSEAVNVVDIAVVYKLVEFITFASYYDEESLKKAREALKLADIIMDEFTDKLEEKV